MIDYERLNNDINMLDLAERYTKLKRNGKGYRGTCPIHHGDNPSAFSVKDNHWHCYTRCGTGGGAVRFYMLAEGVDGIEAAKRLAQMYGLRLDDYGITEESIREEERRASIASVLGAAADFYAERLYSDAGKDALAYLHRRGLTDETIKAARLGWSDGSGLPAVLDAQDARALARQIGLLRADGRDFTANGGGGQAAPWGWIVMPHAYGGQVSYLSARAVELPDTERPNPGDKSRNLPGGKQVYWAVTDATDRRLIIVEGQMDALTLMQLGYNALALCGLTELSDVDMRRIRRYETLALGVDDDQAGRAKLGAMDSAITRLVNEMGPMTLVLTPPAKDWNAAVETLTSEHVERLLDEADTWLDLRLEQAANGRRAELDRRMAEIGALLAKLPEGSRMAYVTTAARQLGIGKTDVRRLITTAAQGSMNESGGLAAIRDGRLEFLGEPLGNFWAKIEREQVLDDGQNAPRVRYRIAGGLHTGERLPSVEIPAEEMPDMRWMPRHWGARVIPYVGRSQYHKLVRAMQEVSIPTLRRETVYEYTGWTMSGGRRAYLSASGALDVDKLDDTVQVDLGQNNLRHYHLPFPPTDNAQIQAAVSASLEFLSLAPLDVTAPLWAAMYAAPLTSVKSLNAVMWIYGTTQTGKSTITHLALTHFGAGFIDGHDYNAPMDWTSTATALEGGMFRVKDAPFVIDDFAPQFASKADSIRMHKKAHYVVRSVGNRSSRSRSSGDLSERVTRVPRGLVIATAENPLVGQSTVGRMIQVSVAAGTVFADRERLDAAQRLGQAGLYSQAMSLYLRWLMTHWETATARYATDVETASGAARSDKRMQNRLPDYFGVLSAAQRMALWAFHEMGVLSAMDASRMADDNDAAILGVIASQAQRVSMESPIHKFVTAIGSLLGRQRVYLAPRTGSNGYVPPERADLIGWYDPDEPERVYFDIETALAHAKDYWRGLDENLDIMPDALARQFQQAGLLLESSPGRTKVSKWVAGRNRWVLAVDGRRVEAEYQVSLKNEA